MDYYVPPGSEDQGEEVIEPFWLNNQFWCLVCGHPYATQREADLCSNMEDWDLYYPESVWDHEDNDYTFGGAYAAD